jgi:serine/threonine protein kinase
MLESSAAGEPRNASLQSADSGESSAANAPTETAASAKSDLISQVISEVIENRARGERISYDQLIASHPELMPELRDALLALDAIHQTVILGLTNAPAQTTCDPDIDKALRIDGYSIEREISSGGQATVFKAVQERTGRVVAIKIMHGGPFMGSRGRKRFDRESKIMAGLSHPNIVGILDKGRTGDGSFYLVMDFVEGCSLDAFVQQLGKDTSAIIKLFVRIANALDEAHRIGIVHRDLKPMNILVDCRGEPHILDFGMARILQNGEGTTDGETERPSLTHTGQVLGSLPWVSPEQVFGSPDAVDARSDVYALGVMLFVSLTGEFPYPVEGGPRLVTHHVANTPPGSLPRLALRHGITVTRSLEEIVLKTLSKSPVKRYGTASLLANDLEAWLVGKQTSLVRNGSRARLWLLILALSGILIPLSKIATTWIEGTPVSESTPTFTNSEGMLFVKVSPGAVVAEIPKDSANFNPPESEPYQIGQVFYMSATVVTQEQYWKVIGQNPSDSRFRDIRFPVQCIRWADAVAFCDALSRLDGRKYRLPTQAEWNYALYRGISGALPQDQINSLAWYAENSGHRLHGVALKRPDRWGLYDMLGNVRQWCSNSPASASNSASARNKSSNSALGIDFLSPASEFLPSSTLETKYKPDTALPTIGFRVVCESP